MLQTNEKNSKSQQRNSRPQERNKNIKKNQMEILEQKNTINNIFKSQEES